MPFLLCLVFFFLSCPFEHHVVETSFCGVAFHSGCPITLCPCGRLGPMQVISSNTYIVLLASHQDAPYPHITSHPIIVPMLDNLMLDNLNCSDPLPEDTFHTQIWGLSLDVPSYHTTSHPAKPKPDNLNSFDLQPWCPSHTDKMCTVFEP